MTKRAFLLVTLTAAACASIAGKPAHLDSTPADANCGLGLRILNADMTDVGGSPIRSAAQKLARPVPVVVDGSFGPVGRCEDELFRFANESSLAPETHGFRIYMFPFDGGFAFTVQEEGLNMPTVAEGTQHSVYMNGHFGGTVERKDGGWVLCDMCEPPVELEFDPGEDPSSSRSQEGDIADGGYGR